MITLPITLEQLITAIAVLGLVRTPRAALNVLKVIERSRNNRPNHFPHCYIKQLKPSDRQQVAQALIQL